MDSPSSEAGEARQGFFLTLNFWITVIAAVVSLVSIVVTVWFSLPSSSGLVLVSTIPSVAPATAPASAAVSEATTNGSERYTFSFLLKNKGDNDYNQSLELYCDTCTSVTARPFDGQSIDMYPKDKTRLLTVDVTAVGFPTLDIVRPDVHPGSGQGWVNWSIIVTLALLLIVDIPLTYWSYVRLDKFHKSHEKAEENLVEHVGSLDEQLSKLSKKVDNLKKGVAEASKDYERIRNTLKSADTKRNDVYPKNMKEIYAGSGRHFHEVLKLDED